MRSDVEPSSYDSMINEVSEHLAWLRGQGSPWNGDAGSITGYRSDAKVSPLASARATIAGEMPKRRAGESVPPPSGDAPPISVGAHRAKYVGPITPSQFASKWSGNTNTERATAQEHFIDLCRMLGFKTPNEADSTGASYAFEKGASKTGGGDGFADVWKRGHFGWEYKRTHKNLNAAYSQLLLYREALENPPLLVVCDLERFQVHTNFTNTIKQTYEFTLSDLASKPEEPLRILRALMGEPEALRPNVSLHELTANRQPHRPSGGQIRQPHGAS